VSTTGDSGSADVRQKKGQTFQASWKGKYQWIDYDAAKKKQSIL